MFSQLSLPVCNEPVKRGWSDSKATLGYSRQFWCSLGLGITCRYSENVNLDQVCVGHDMVHSEFQTRPRVQNRKSALSTKSGKSMPGLSALTVAGPFRRLTSETIPQVGPARVCLSRSSQAVASCRKLLGLQRISNSNHGCQLLISCLSVSLFVKSGPHCFAFMQVTRSHIICIILYIETKKKFFQMRMHTSGPV